MKNILQSNAKNDSLLGDLIRDILHDSKAPTDELSELVEYLNIKAISSPHIKEAINELEDLFD